MPNIARAITDHLYRSRVSFLPSINWEFLGIRRCSDKDTIHNATRVGDNDSGGIHNIRHLIIHPVIYPQKRSTVAPLEVVRGNDSITMFGYNSLDDFVLSCPSDGEQIHRVDTNHWGLEVLKDKTCGSVHGSAVDSVVDWFRRGRVWKIILEAERFGHYANLGSTS